MGKTFLLTDPGKKYQIFQAPYSVLDNFAGHAAHEAEYYEQEGQPVTADKFRRTEANLSAALETADLIVIEVIPRRSHCY